MKIRSTWHEALFVPVRGRLTRVNPGDVVDVDDGATDLLTQNDGTKFEAVTPPKKKAE